MYFVLVYMFLVFFLCPVRVFRGVRACGLCGARVHALSCAGGGSRPPGVFGILGGGIYFFLQAWKRSPKVQVFMDRALLKLPVFGALIDKSCIARWTRTLSTMFAAGVPLVEALDSVGGASGNIIYKEATDKIQKSVSIGTSLAVAMTDANVFPSMVLQMCAIGEESGAIDHMLGKAADFYEAEVDEMVAGLSSLMEPIIIVFLGTIIGGIVVSMYLPIFKLGQVV